MAFRWKRTESLEAGLQRTALEQVERAADELRDRRLATSVKVHQVRKRCKNVRSLLVLVQPVDRKLYERENAWFRDTARRLSPARDAQTRFNALESLRMQFADSSALHAYPQLVAALSAQTPSPTDWNEEFLWVEQRLQNAAARIPTWRVQRKEAVVICQGVARAYRKGATAMQEAYAAPSAGAFHEWRKFVGAHWRHCRVLEGCWPPVMGAQRREARRLAETLGMHHDLAVLRQFVADEGAAGNDSATAALAALIDERCQALQIACRPLGESLFAERPHAFARRISAYWKIWKKYG